LSNRYKDAHYDKKTSKRQKVA